MQTTSDTKQQTHICLICQDNKASVLTLPCHHMQYCNKCWPQILTDKHKLSKCSLCSTAIELFINQDTCLQFNAIALADACTAFDGRDEESEFWVSDDDE